MLALVSMDRQLLFFLVRYPHSIDNRIFPKLIARFSHNYDFSSVDALVQLQSGTGNVVSSVTTNTAGMFSILLDPLQFNVSSILSNYRLVVATPLNTCNASLPTGLLSAPLERIQNTIVGILPVINIIPRVFVRIG